MKPVSGWEPCHDPRHAYRWTFQEDVIRRLIQSILALQRQGWAATYCTACDEDLLHFSAPRQN